MLPWTLLLLVQTARAAIPYYPAENIMGNISLSTGVTGAVPSGSVDFSTITTALNGKLAADKVSLSTGVTDQLPASSYQPPSLSTGITGTLGTANIAASAVTDPKVNLTTGAISSGKWGDNRVGVSTVALASGKWGDSQVVLSTAGVTSGKFTDDKVSISTQGFYGGFNAASKLVQLDGSGNLPAVGGAALTGTTSMILPSGLLSGVMAVTVLPSTVAYTSVANTFTALQTTSSGTINSQLTIPSLNQTQINGRTPGGAGTEMVFNSTLVQVCISTGATKMGYKVVGTASTTCR